MYIVSDFILKWETTQEDKLVIEEMFNGFNDYNRGIHSVQKLLINSTYGSSGMHPSFDINYLRKK
jgi:hypothetical protein